MKRTVFLLIACMLLSAGCGNAAASPAETVEAAVEQVEEAPVIPDVVITENMFVEQVNDIYINIEDYLGKTIKLEGMFRFNGIDQVDNPRGLVYRNTWGCCGTDGVIGFEVIWHGDIPEDNEWVEAVGVFDYCEEFDYRYLCITLSSLEVLPIRGEEVVQ